MSKIKIMLSINKQYVYFHVKIYVRIYANYCILYKAWLKKNIFKIYNK